MIKLILFILMGIMLIGCGQKGPFHGCKVKGSFVGCDEKSEIKNYVLPGDPNSALREGLTITLPLSDQSLAAYEADNGPDIFLLSGIAKGVMNLFAKIGMGKMQFSMTQPIPEIPSEVSKKITSLKVKRIFFFMDAQDRKRKSSIWNKFKGKGNIDFSFLDKIGITLSSKQIVQTGVWAPVISPVTTLSEEGNEILKAMFDKEEKRVYGNIVDVNELKELELVKYDNNEPEHYLRNKSYGPMYIIDTDKPVEMKNYLEQSPYLVGYIKPIRLLNKSILVELQKDPVAKEIFNAVISESEFKTVPEECKEEKTCLDLKVPDVNLMPLILKGNAIQLDAYLRAEKVPESFQLKGFIEFEIKGEFFQKQF